MLIIFGQWEIETSLWMAALLALIFFVVIYAILRIIVRGTLWPHQWRMWREARREKNAQRLIEVATCELIEEKWAAAEQHFCEAATGNSSAFSGIYRGGRGSAGSGGQWPPGRIFASGVPGRSPGGNSFRNTAG